MFIVVVAALLLLLCRVRHFSLRSSMRICAPVGLFFTGWFVPWVTVTAALLAVFDLLIVRC
jgi:hypothetical protein